MAALIYRRYTELPSLIHMLSNGELTLLSPQTWDDRNDSYFMEQYRQKRGLRSVLALCFSKASETYHHWWIFAPGSAGVCVCFKALELKSAARLVPHVKFKPVEYLKLDEARTRRLSTGKLPFLKRYPFEAESEIRMVWESKAESLSSLPVPFPETAIDRIKLSPWLHDSIVDDVRSLLRSLPGCKHYKVYKSTLVSNDEWQRRGASAR
jgi:hypothetical protein